MQFIQDHPGVAAGSFALSAVPAAGLSHHFLDLEWPYAIAVGAGTGAAVVGVEGFAYAEYTGFKNWLTGWLGAAGAAAGGVVRTTEEVAGGVEKKLDDMVGIDPDKSGGSYTQAVKDRWTDDKTAIRDLWTGELAAVKTKEDVEFYYRNSPHENVQRAAKKVLDLWDKAVVNFGRDSDLAARFRAAVEELRYAIAHPEESFDETDARFTTNYENPYSKAPVDQKPPDADLEKEEAQWDLAHPDEVAAAAEANGSGSFEQSKEAFENRQKQDPLANAPPGFRRY